MGWTGSANGWIRWCMRKLIFDFWYGRIIAPIWQMKRRIVLSRGRGRCHYCLEKLTPKTFTVDHVVPLSAGGTDALRNLVACCKYCNKFKGSKLMDARMEAEMCMMAYRRDRHRARTRNL